MCPVIRTRSRGGGGGELGNGPGWQNGRRRDVRSENFKDGFCLYACYAWVKGGKYYFARSDEIDGTGPVFEYMYYVSICVTLCKFNNSSCYFDYIISF